MLHKFEVLKPCMIVKGRSIHHLVSQVCDLCILASLSGCLMFVVKNAAKNEFLLCGELQECTVKNPCM